MSCHCNGIGINIESVGVMPIRQMIEEITHAAAHVEYHFRRLRGKHPDHVAAYLVRCEELAHLELLLGLGILVVTAEIGTPQVMQPSDTGVTVVYALRRYGVLARIYAEEYLIVYLLPLFRWYLLGYDGVHGCLVIWL